MALSPKRGPGVGGTPGQAGRYAMHTTDSAANLLDNGCYCGSPVSCGE